MFLHLKKQYMQPRTSVA